MEVIRDEYGEEYEAELVSSPDSPYLEYEYKKIVKRYNPNFGDTKKCKCGHIYEVHFDSYENMEPCGCKYCGCFEFEENRHDY